MTQQVPQEAPGVVIVPEARGTPARGVPEVAVAAQAHALPTDDATEGMSARGGVMTGLPCSEGSPSRNLVVEIAQVAPLR